MLGLQDSITMNVCFPSRTDDEDSQGRTGLWQFAPNGITTRNGRFVSFRECTDETVLGGKKTVAEIYDSFGMTEKSVPILFDKQTGTIVNNESAEIVRMLGLHREALGTTFAEVPTLSPEALQSQIDETSDWIYHAINNGAYTR
jgi:glutathionyl-hydroquinone reductase